MNSKELQGLQKANEELVSRINAFLADDTELSSDEKHQVLKEIYDTGIGLKLLAVSGLVDEIAEGALDLKATTELLRVKEDFFKLDLMMYKDFIDSLAPEIEE